MWPLLQAVMMQSSSNPIQLMGSVSTILDWRDHGETGKFDMYLMMHETYHHRGQLCCSRSRLNRMLNQIFIVYAIRGKVRVRAKSCSRNLAFRAVSSYGQIG